MAENTEIKERPILFSDAMVRAIIEGRKTQTRRVVKPQPEQIPADVPPAPGDNGWWWPAKDAQSMVQLRDMGAFCPFGRRGDRLWVRESGWERPERTPKMMREGADTWPRFAYAADNWSADDRADFKRWGFKPRPSIHMPRWASRILLEIVAVRVERLNDISEADTVAEGIQPEPGLVGYDDIMVGVVMDRLGVPAPVARFVLLWDSINGKVPANWNSNPYVWVVEFRRVQA